MHISTSQEPRIDVPKVVLQGVGMGSGQGIDLGYLIEWQRFVGIWLIVAYRNGQWRQVEGGRLNCLVEQGQKALLW